MMALLHAVSTKSVCRNESDNLEEASYMLQFVSYILMHGHIQWGGGGRGVKD
jgi:hypothetical protein